MQKNNMVCINKKILFVLIFIILLAGAFFINNQINSNKVSYKSQASEKKVKTYGNLYGGSAPNFVLALNVIGGTKPTYVNLGAGTTAPLFIGGNFTVETWIKIPRDDGHTFTDLIYNQRTNSNANFYTIRVNLYKQENSYTVNSSVLTTGDKPGRYLDTTSDKAISYGTWNHIAVVGSTAISNNDKTCHLQIYINGVLSGDQNIAVKDLPNCRFDASNLGTFILGKDMYSSATFQGYVDELRFTNSRLYTQNFFPQIPPLSLRGQTSALYHFSNNFNNEYPYGKPAGPIGLGYIFVEEDIQNAPMPTITPPSFKIYLPQILKQFGQ